MFLFRGLFRREKVSEKSALRYGSIYHYALEEIEKKPNITLAEISTEIYKRFDPPPTDWRTPDHLLKSLTLYRKRWESEGFRTIKGKDGQPLVELPFSLPLAKVTVEAEVFSDIPEYMLAVFGTTEKQFIKEVHVYWTGRIDKIVQEDFDQFVLDHKTASMTGETYFKNFELAQPTIGYCWAARQMGYPVVGLILDVIVGRQPTKTGKAYEFERRKFFYPEHRLNEFVPNTVSIIQNLISCIVTCEFPRHTNVCCGKFGMCQFHDICLSPPEQRINQLHNNHNYNITLWSPLT